MKKRSIQEVKLKKEHDKDIRAGQKSKPWQRF
jgi:hypothetical protein